MLNKSYFLQTAAAVLYFSLSAGIGEAKVWIKPIVCYHFEHHGFNKLYMLRKAMCSYETQSCRHWEGNKAVPAFAANKMAPYYKANCGKCSASESDCKECTTNYCNYKVAWPGPYGSVTLDLMEQLLPLSSNKVSSFDPRVPKEKKKDMNKKKSAGQTAASDFVSGSDKLDNNSGQRLMPIAGKPTLSLIASVVALMLAY